MLGTVSMVIAPSAMAENAKPQSEQLIQSDKGITGTPYASYPQGRPQLTVLRIKFPAHATLPWHTHVVPNAAYVVSG
ncbi:MAG: cupin, partial [Proteobacteria bacterium]